MAFVKIFLYSVILLPLQDSECFCIHTTLIVVQLSLMLKKNLVHDTLRNGVAKAESHKRYLPRLMPMWQIADSCMHATPSLKEFPFHTYPWRRSPASAAI